MPPQQAQCSPAFLLQLDTTMLYMHGGVGGQYISCQELLNAVPD